MKINFKAAMIFDAICACNLICNHGSYNKSEQNEVLDILKERTGELFLEGGISYSTMCMIVATYFQDPFSATLDDLCLMFESISDVDAVLRNKIKSEFKKSFIFPTLDMLKKDGAKKYCQYIIALKEAGFEALWREKILPIEQAQIERLESALTPAELDAMLTVVSELKGVSYHSVTTYISLLSYPVSFALTENSFLDTINDYGEDYRTCFSTMIAHELMHGFASSAVTNAYLNFMDGSRYLRSTHKSLIQDIRSGDEEEFVMAAEYYILWRSKILSKREIVLQNYARCRGCVPLAFYIFDHMTRETQPIRDYNGWLLKAFDEERFTKDNIFSTVDSLLPVPNDYDGFYTNLFVILHRCAYILRDAQLTVTEDIKQGIEQLTNAR